MNTSPMCCGTVSSYVDNVPGKEYYYCRECRKEVVATPNNEEYALTPIPLTYDSTSLKPHCYYETRYFSRNWHSNRVGNIVAVPSPHRSEMTQRPPIGGVTPGQVFEPYRYSEYIPYLEVVSVNRETGVITMKVVQEPLPEEEGNEPFDY